MDEDMDLEDAQTAICGLIDDYRASISNTYFTYDGHEWACDQVSKQNVIGACVLAIVNGGNLPPGYVWRDEANVNVPVTGQMMLMIGVEMFKYLSACYQASWIHKGNVQALTDVPSVLAYDYMSTLWPSPDVQL